MENKFYKFAIVTLVIINIGALILGRFVEGYYGLKNILYFIMTACCIMILAMTFYFNYKK